MRLNRLKTIVCQCFSGCSRADGGAAEQLYEEETLHMFNSCNRRPLMKMEKILLPFDGSIHSINATKYALKLAQLSGAHVTIVYCYEWRGNVSELPE